MPSPIAHSISGYVFCKVWLQRRNLVFSSKTANLWGFYLVFISNLPDLDFIAQFFLDDQVHRGFTHSVTATFGVSLFAGLVGFIYWRSRWRQLWLITLLVYGLHLCLDALTAGGAGMKLLWPLSEEYYKLPFSLFPPVHHSRGLFDLSHLIFLSYELAYAILLMLGLRRLWFSQKRPRNNVLK